VFAYRPLYVKNTTKTPEADGLNLYTSFPFKRGRCGEAENIILLDGWVFEINDKFLENSTSFSCIISKGFQAFSINVAAIGIETVVIITENSTQNIFSNTYKSINIRVEIFKLFCEKMNKTKIFLPTSLDFNHESFAKEIGVLEEGLSDVLTRCVYLLPNFVTFSFETTIPYEYISAK